MKSRLSEVPRDILCAVVPLAQIQGRFPSAVDVRPAWISQSEWLESECLTHSVRRWQWLAGRWVAKMLIARNLAKRLGAQPDRHQISLRSRDSQGRSTRPKVWVSDRPVALSCSISHDSKAAAAAVSWKSSPGIDLVGIGRGQARCPLPGFEAQELQWSLIEAGFKTGITGDSFQPFQWRVSRISEQRYLIEAPDRTSIPGCVRRVKEWTLALCWQKGESSR